MNAKHATLLLANDSEAPDPVVAVAACELARRIGANLSVVHVAGGSQQAAEDHLAPELPAYTVLATLVAQCATAGKAVTRASLRYGVAEREILAEAAAIGAGLIVVSGRTCAPPQRRRDAELGEYLGRCATCPVLIVRDDEPGKARARLTIGGTGAPPRRITGRQQAVAV